MAAAALLAVALLAGGATEPTGATRLDKTDWLVTGSFEPGRQPDGNSIVMTGPTGVIVIDTGRHASHSDGIIAAIRATGKPLVAIVNSHWHLDHVSGNPRLRAAYPGAGVWATGAIDGALAGFLRTSAAQGQAALDAGDLPSGLTEDVRGDIATVAAGAQLRPDHVVSASGPVTLAGRRLTLTIAPRAATEADLWVYDAAHRRAIVGDLVTLPAPFLDTACPEGWAAALETVDRTPFRTLVPGHGSVMDRPAFAAWRTAFTRFLACGQDATRAVADCAAGWMAYAAPLLPDTAQKQARGLADYYAGLLRSDRLRQNCTGRA